MESVRSTWTDSRLDDLKVSVDSRLDKLDARVGDLSGRIDALQHTVLHAFIGMMVAMVTGFVALAGLIVTKL